MIQFIAVNFYGRKPSRQAEPQERPDGRLFHPSRTAGTGSRDEIHTTKLAS